MDLKLFQMATGCHKEVPKTWVSGTGVRALIQEDPALTWLKYHGKAHGLEEDPAEYSFLNWIGDKGRAFEAKWIKEVCPEAVQAMEEDVDVRRVQGLVKTLGLMSRQVPVISKAAVWNAEARIYGSCDIICLASWLYAKFPHLKPQLHEPDHYIVIDCKYSSGLDDNEKKVSLACNSAQVRMYSYMLGRLQGYMPRYAYLVTRDRPFDPIPVEVNHRLDGPLDPYLAELRDRHIQIKLEGDQMTPWTHDLVKANFSNKKDEPWHQAKKRIANHLRPLEWLPHVGRSQVAELNQSGVTCLDHVLSMHPNAMNWEALKGIGKTTAPRIRAVLEANRSGRPSSVPASLVPPRASNEFYIDYEFLSSVNVDFENDWPAMKGREMVFMVGVGWERAGRWCYRQFVAASETSEAERAMFQEFLGFLHHAGTFNSLGGAVLYHWTGAEVTQSARAAERLGIPQLAALPWNDLQKPFHAGPIALPECWDFSLKSVARALGAISREHRVEWPELDSGLAASVMGWRMYEQTEPLKSPELEMLSQYLEIDCKAMWAVLSWMRAVAVEEHHGYEPAQTKRKTSKPKPSKTRRSKPKGGRSRARRRSSELGWYRYNMDTTEELSQAVA